MLAFEFDVCTDSVRQFPFNSLVVFVRYSCTVDRSTNRLLYVGAQRRRLSVRRRNLRAQSRLAGLFFSEFCNRLGLGKPDLSVH